MLGSDTTEEPLRVAVASEGSRKRARHEQYHSSWPVVEEVLMLLAEFKAPMSYGLLIIAAPESRDPHDGWDPATSGTVHAGPDSLYVGVADPATGLVSVACHEGAGGETHLGRLFAGELQLPSARLEFSDPEESVKISVPVSSERVSLIVYADNAREPRELVVEVAPVG